MDDKCMKTAINFPGKTWEDCCQENLCAFTYDREKSDKTTTTIGANIAGKINSTTNTNTQTNGTSTVTSNSTSDPTNTTSNSSTNNINAGTGNNTGSAELNFTVQYNLSAEQIRGQKLSCMTSLSMDEFKSQMEAVFSDCERSIPK